MKSVISPSERMQALALFTMANQNYLRAAKYGEALSELLGGAANDFILGDVWLEEGPNFDTALKDAGYVVRKRKVRKSKRKK
jgi:hypothetical protein